MVKDTTVKDKQKTKEEREGWAGCGEFLSHTDVSRKMTVNEMVKELGNAGFQAKKVAGLPFPPTWIEKAKSPCPNSNSGPTRVSLLN